MGLPIGYVRTELSEPLFTLQRQSVKKDTLRILQECRKQAIDHVVVGLPLQLDGTEGRSAKLARQIGSAIVEEGSYTVSYCDERFSTVEASRRLRKVEKAAVIKSRLLIKQLQWSLWKTGLEPKPNK